MNEAVDIAARWVAVLAIEPEEVRGEAVLALLATLPAGVRERVLNAAVDELLAAENEPREGVTKGALRLPCDE
jgi:hypothetical protein